MKITIQKPRWTLDAVINALQGTQILADMVRNSRVVYFTNSVYNSEKTFLSNFHDWAEDSLNGLYAVQLHTGDGRNGNIFYFELKEDLAKFILAFGE